MSRSSYAWFLQVSCQNAPFFVYGNNGLLFGFSSWMTTVSARDWQVGDNGLSRWDWNCDFNGRDIGTSPASGELNLLNLDALTLLTAMELVTRIALPTESSMAIQLHPDGFVVTFQIVSMGAVKQLLIFVKENDIDPFFKMLKNVETFLAGQLSISFERQGRSRRLST